MFIKLIILTHRVILYCEYTNLKLSAKRILGNDFSNLLFRGLITAEVSGCFRRASGT